MPAEAESTLYNSMGNAWTADYLKITGDLAVDLRSNIAAEARAKIVYERLIAFTDDVGSKQALQFLMTREITHMRAFTAALDSMEKPQFSVGIIQPTPGLVDQYFNASTGENELGDKDFVGPWNNGRGLHVIGSGLEVSPYTPQPGTEVTSPHDSTPVGEDVGNARAKIGQSPRSLKRESVATRMPGEPARHFSWYARRPLSHAPRDPGAHLLNYFGKGVASAMP